MGEAKRRRERIIQQMRDQGVDQPTAEHVHDKFIDRERLAAEMRAKGHAISTALIYTGEREDIGYEISCFKCGRKARQVVKPRPGTGAMCPQCAAGAA